MRCKELAEWLNGCIETIRLEKVQAIAAGAAQKIEAERSQQARREALEGTSTIDLIAEIEYRVSVECEGLTEEETAKLFDLSGRDWSDLYDDMGPFDKQVLVEELASGGHYAANGDDDDVSRLKDACVRRRDSDIVYFVQQIAADQGYPGWRPRS